MGGGELGFYVWAHPWRLGWDSQNLLLLPEAGREVTRGRVLDLSGPGPCLSTQKARNQCSADMELRGTEAWQGEGQGR